MLTVRIGGIEDCDMVNGGSGNVTHSIFFAGCSRNCPGCQNTTLQPKDSGTEVKLKEVVASIIINKLANCVAFLGGEPLEQPRALQILVDAAKSEGKKVYLYTGCEFDEIPTNILNKCDVVKTGRYIEELRINDGPLATSNQRYHFRGDDGVWRSN